MTYPEKHRDIVAELLAGRFILESSPLFRFVNKERNFYTHFFSKTYGYELNTQHNYFFLTSKDTQEETSRDFILLLALLAYEFHNEQRDFVKELKEKIFSVADIALLVKESTKYEDLIKGTKAEEFEKFINTWHGRHLLSFVDNDKQYFRFNDPINTFLEVALELSNLHLIEAEVIT